MSSHIQKADDVVESQHAEFSAAVDRDAMISLSPVPGSDRHLGVFQTAKLHWRVLLYCCSAFSAAGMFGYDSVANGASLSMPAFFIYYGDIGPTGPYLPSMWTALWGCWLIALQSAFSYLAQAAGAFMSGVLIDRFGRKWTGAACAALTIAGTAVQFTATTRAALLVGKMISGYGVGAAMAAGTAYASEITPPKLRAPVQQAIVLFTVIMYAVSLAIIRAFVPDTTPRAFRTVFAIQWVVGGLSTIAFLLVPESPVYLVNRDRHSAARSALTQIYGASKDIDVHLQDLVRTIEGEQTARPEETDGYLDCFRGVDLKRTLTAVFIYASVPIAGGPLLSQNILILIGAGLPAIHAFDVGIGGFGLAIILVVVNWFTMNLFRRHNMFMAGGIVNLILMVVIGALYYIPGQSALWAAASIMNVLIVLQTILLQVMGFPIAAELSTYRLRGKTMAMATIGQAISNWFFSFVVPYMYNVDSGDLGLRSAFVFAGLSVFLIVGTWFLVPDTAEMTAAEIDHAYISRVPTRKFRVALIDGRL